MILNYPVFYSEMPNIEIRDMGITQSIDVSSLYGANKIYDNL